MNDHMDISIVFIDRESGLTKKYKTVLVYFILMVGEQ